MTANLLHGNKRRFQVLLDPNRAALFDALAEQEGLKTPAFLRKKLYEALESSVSSARYDKAEQQDEEFRLLQRKLQAEIRRKRS